jgi:protoheme ferro-lyase
MTTKRVVRQIHEQTSADVCSIPHSPHCSFSTFGSSWRKASVEKKLPHIRRSQALDVVPHIEIRMNS